MADRIGDLAAQDEYVDPQAYKLLPSPEDYQERTAPAARIFIGASAEPPETDPFADVAARTRSRYGRLPVGDVNATTSDVIDTARSIPRGMLEGFANAAAHGGAAAQIEQGETPLPADQVAPAGISAIEGATGDWYQPRTPAGQYGRAMGEVLGNPANYVGTRLPFMIGMNALSGAAGQAGRDLYKGTPQENVAGVLGTWLPAIAERTLPLYSSIPTGAAGVIGGKLQQPANPRAVIGHNNPPPDVPEVTGSLNPLDNVPVTFRGKDLRDLSPDELQAFGEHFGVNNLGRLSPLQTVVDANGKAFSIPGGTQGKWTYYDLLHMKANPINPAEMDLGLHTELQRKLGRTHTPDNLTDQHVWNGLVFGMTSPNQPLLPNQLAASRMRFRDPAMIDDLASMIPWEPGATDVPKAVRDAASDQIAARFGLQAETKGGIGARGTQNYTYLAEMAKLFKRDPSFFRKQPNETWGQAVERIASQTKGLSMKTGSFGMVWQDPANAAISAIDRHMARLLDERGGVFLNDAERQAWQNRAVSRWNSDMVKAKTPDRQVASFDELAAAPGTEGHLGKMLLEHVGDATEPKFRYATGQVNPHLPAHIQNAQWAKEPEKVMLMGAAYKRALGLNQKLADEAGLPLFMGQWMHWDRVRNRFEPHENMFPGLERLPAPSLEQLRAVDEAHRFTGHKTYGKDEEGSLAPTRPLGASPSRMGYLGLGGAVLGPAVMGELAKQDERR
jgi:hypothetical protein